MKSQQQTINKIIELAKANDTVEVVWLYGSRARGSANESSDYDLAVAFKPYLKDPVKRRLRPEMLALEWRQMLEIDLSILDINQVPIQLAYSVIQDNNLIYSSNDFRLMVEEQKIMSKWEIDHLYHRKHYA